MHNTTKSSLSLQRLSDGCLAKSVGVTPVLPALLTLALLPSLLLASCGGRSAAPEKKVATAENKEGQQTKDGEHKDGAEQGDEVKLSAEALKSAQLEYATVTAQASGGLLRVAATIEANERQVQQATPLVGGRVERVHVALGDRVRAGQTLAVISSPQIAQMHGKLHEAETGLALAERAYQRVQKAENRVAVLAAKARLDEAEATLKRTQRLIELGAGAGKDLIAAQTVYQTAKAEYEFQSNIALNREVQEARAAVETARVDVRHARDELRALGAQVNEHEPDDHQHDTALIALSAPISGTVTERKVNAGAGVEAGQSIFTVANFATVWVMANVPEAQMVRLRPGAPAVVRATALGDRTITGRVNYIDPRLNEETRTARVRIEVANPGELLRAGMFAEVELQTGAGVATGTELVVPEAALQRMGERTLVFIPEEGEAGGFKARQVEVGGTTGGMTRILNGLKDGERVVTKGSFTLRAQMQKSELGEDDH